jgi:hypothetical protein
VVAGYPKISTKLFVGSFFSIICFTLNCQEPMQARFRSVNSVLFKWTAKSFIGAAGFVFKTLLKNPKITALLLSICFYKEILYFVQQEVSYFVGEFPEVSFILAIYILWAISITSSDE